MLSNPRLTESVSASEAIPLEVRLRDLAPQVLAALLRRGVPFDSAEDAVQESLLAAVSQWPTSGMPTNARGWLITVANRRLTDAWRSDHARAEREITVATHVEASQLVAPPPDAEPETLADDTLTLLFLCCHPALTAASQIALTLRAVGGLTTTQIAHAFLTPEATMAQRISRAKQRIRSTGIPFQMPASEHRQERIDAVLHVLYLIFNEGYTTSSGSTIDRPDLANEAIRLARQMHYLLPHDGEITGLLALMLLTDARRPARTTPTGDVIPLADQNRALWNESAITEGTSLVAQALAQPGIGPYRLQAAIAALHDEALTADTTDWQQILALYTLLERLGPNPMVTLNRVVAHAMVHGAPSALSMLHSLELTGDLADHHRLHAVKAHLHELQGDRDAAIRHYRLAAEHTTSLPEQRYLIAQADRLEIAT